MSQYIIIGGDGKEYGPVSAAEVHEWVKGGRANGDTRIKPEGAEDWWSLRDVPEVAAALAPPVAPPTPPPSSYGSPAFPPEMGLGQDPPLPADVFTRDHSVWSAGCFERGWDVFSKYMGGSIGVFVLFMVIIVAIILFSIIPFIGIFFSLASMIFQPVLLGGLMYFFIKAQRGQNPDVGDLFSGFSRNFAGLFLVNFIQGLIILATMIPGLVMMGIAIGAPLLEAIRTKSVPDIGGASVLLIIAGVFVMILPALYLGICWAFALPLAVDRRIDFWQAMQTSRKVVNKHWFQLFFFFMIVGIIAELGILACGVGLLFTAPLAFCINMAAYEHLFGARTGNPAGGTPTPPMPQP
ncbi:MAG: DUF975 family protein [Verrucomicrobia subdivision 3 bacterium]|nr:DUF975 family protein [Limisphaerales bacterium]